MPTYSHPGIYIEEIPSTRSVQGASTSVAAFVGVTESGPYNTPTLITSWNAFTRQFGSLTWYGFTPWAVYEFFIEGGTSCYIVRTPDNNAAKAAIASAGGTKLAAASVGTWGNSLQLYVCNNGGDATTTAPVFNLLVVVDAAVINGSGGKPPAFDTLPLPTQLLVSYVVQNGLATTTINSKPYYVLEAFNGFVAANAAFVTRINTQSMFIRVTAADDGRPPNTKTPSAFSGGTLPNWDFTNAVNSLRTVQALSLLAVPDTVSITNSTGQSDPVAQAKQINQGLMTCESLASLFYVIDPPFGQNVQGIVSFKSGSATSQALNSSYGALYYPWTWIFNPLNSSSVPLPPSGPTLGRYAYTDLNIGVWKSPAGVNDGAMRSVVALFVPLTDADQDNLNPYGINALRNLINYGNVIYGARTVSQDTQWTYVSVRRLFIYVEQSLKNSLQWVVFEPNGQQLWSAVSRDIAAFLTNLWQSGALFGATAAEAFFVTCDASNNPPETRALGQLFIDIGLAPVYPAEFVIIRITQKTAGPDSGV
ncbi:phage tail sheath family protein [Chitinimonas arctica]|uniref:Phage tail sheath family protein n=1 Tax=Chitinimonas arctica TaxID=2594795 RepID=A0A516SIM9_9NEIS|nr:phage tail sheath C-terminal domain-containing protein [Chitinimonas arctica]QDQ28006.1 phage tail sheath family protein [Chitinimonas arctica]